MNLLKIEGKFRASVEKPKTGMVIKQRCLLYCWRKIVEVIDFNGVNITNRVEGECLLSYDHYFCLAMGLIRAEPRRRTNWRPGYWGQSTYAIRSLKKVFRPAAPEASQVFNAAVPIMAMSAEPRNASRSALLLMPKPTPMGTLVC